MAASICKAFCVFSTLFLGQQFETVLNQPTPKEGYQKLTVIIFNITNPWKEFKKPLKKLFDGFTDTQGLRELILVVIKLVCGLGGLRKGQKWHFGPFSNFLTP